MAETLGRPLFPWQRYVLDVALEVDADGQWAYDEIGVFAPRRAGKSFVMQALATDRCLRSRSVVAMTAQNGMEAGERWLDIVDRKGGSGLMQSAISRALHATTGTGNKFLHWPNGSVFYPFTPNEKANHGSEPDLVFVDELWALTTVDKGILQQGWRPAWSVKTGQEWLFSAAGTMLSTWLHDVRKRGLASLKPGRTRPARIAYFDWGINSAQRKLKGDALVDAVIQAHPRRDHGLRHSYVASELETLGEPAFLRAYGNVDAEGGVQELAIPLERLKAGPDADRIPPGASGVVLGVHADENRRASTICAARMTSSGRLRVEVVRHAPGTKWVVAYAQAMSPDLVSLVNVKVNRALGDDLEAAGVPLQRVSQADDSAATSDWLAALGETDRVSLDGSPHLEAALRNAHAPNAGAWASRTGEEISTLKAHTMAVWAAGHKPVAPARVPFRVW